MNKLIEAIKQNLQVWAWAIIVCSFLILVGHAPAMPIVAGGLLAIAVTTLRTLSTSQKKPWQVKVQR
jgi:hypothetical protein